LWSVPSSSVFSGVTCDDAEIVCKDADLAGINRAIGEREQLLAGAAMHPALRGEIEQSEEDWRAGLAECDTGKDIKACYRTRLQQRLAVMTLLSRLFAGPHLVSDPAQGCAAQKRDIRRCVDDAFTTADTVYGIMARALATSLSTVDIQSTSSQNGGSIAARAEDAFRAWRSAKCQLLELSPLVEKRSGGAVACEAALTWREAEELASLLGRAAHWSEQIDEIAGGVRACLDRGRDDDVELRVIDVFRDDEAGQIIRLLGSRGRYDCVATGNVASKFSPVPAKVLRPGEGAAVFVPVQGLRSPQDVLATMPNRSAGCYATSAVIQADARLSGWIALSRCD
jgi:hypothetical protein